MALIEVKAWINEIKPSKFGEIWKIAESHSKKNADGKYENDGKSFYDVFVDATEAGRYAEGSQVIIKGYFRTKKNGDYTNLTISAKEVELADRNSSPTAAPIAHPSAAGSIPTTWTQVDDAPF